MKNFINRILRWIASTRTLLLPRRILRTALSNAISSKHGILTIFYHSEPERCRVLDLIIQIKKETEMLLLDGEAYQIYMAVKKTEKIEGDIAEIGVYRGGSAKLICEAKGMKNLHLFDTFEGLPQTSESDTLSYTSKTKMLFQKGQFNTSVEDIRNYLREYPNINIHKGFFPESAKPIKNITFSFVHMDVDLYQSTRDCLEFFYPRMNKGGVIISHDYANAPGVMKAFDEFFQNRPEPVLELCGSQCLVQKLETTSAE